MPPTDARPARTGSDGFTLVELVVAIVLLGIVALMVTTFATGAMQSYLDAERRAELVDGTETAMRRLQRDVRLALPNSVRVASDGSTVYLEFLPVVAGGRYRAELAGRTPAGACGVGSNDPLAFGAADSSFSTLGPVADLPNDGGTYYVVVYNLGAGFTAADAYASGAATGGNKARYSREATGACESVIAHERHTFTLASPSNRFHLVARPVTYACDLRSGQLLRYGGYDIEAMQPMPPRGTPALVLDGVTGCTITYDPDAVSQRIGVVSIALERSAGGESVRLYQDVRVDNAP
ncbi:MAG: type II secretion system GspH family protein [Betaproteobacteria bacterium]|jgi:MSHA biogenesis protein MshO|nr:type II secretion system GspH family protein [Betaproteobacteria bacterium]